MRAERDADAYAFESFSLCSEQGNLGGNSAFDVARMEAWTNRYRLDRRDICIRVAISAHTFPFLSALLASFDFIRRHCARGTALRHLAVTIISLEHRNRIGVERAAMQS